MKLNDSSFNISYNNKFYKQINEIVRTIGRKKISAGENIGCENLENGKLESRKLVGENLRSENIVVENLGGKNLTGEKLVGKNIGHEKFLVENNTEKKSRERKNDDQLSGVNIRSEFSANDLS